MRMTRRELATLVGAAMLAPTAFAQTAAPLSRAIPSSGERLPAVGLGTDEIVANNESTRQKAAAVVQALVGNGGRLIDTASSYGEAETVLGDVHRRRRFARQALHRHQT